MAISSPINKGSFTKPSVLKELKAINIVSMKLYNEKKKRFSLQKKFDNLMDKYGERTQYSDRESSQETKKSSRAKSFSKFVRPQLAGLGSFLFDLMKVFVSYKILEWAANPENTKTITVIAKVFFALFKIVDVIVGFGVDALLTGLSEVLGGDSILERIGGVFKLLTGWFIISKVLRYGNISNIGKDLASLWKKRNLIVSIFKKLTDGKFGEAITKLFKLTFPKLSGIFRRGIGKTIQLTIRKVFGKGALKLITNIATKLGLKTATNLVKVGLAKTAGTLGKGIPVVGPFIGLAINLLLGDSIDTALVKLVGSMIGESLGGIAGGAIGLLFGGVGAVPGAIIGAALGGIVGDAIAGSLYGWIKSAWTKPKEPKLALGGIVTQETRAIIGEAGPEAVIPLPQLLGGAIFNEPIAMLGSGLIGGMNAVITSMGPAGMMIRPFANQLLAPYTKEFGAKNYVFNSDIGKSSDVITTTTKTDTSKKTDDKKLSKILGNNDPKLLTSKDSNPRARYNSGNSVFSLLGDIYNSLFNIDFKSGTDDGTTGAGAPGAGGGGGNPPGNIDLKGNSNAEKVFRHLVDKEGFTPEAAAGIIGNLMQESSVDPKKLQLNGGKGRGIMQWTVNERWASMQAWAKGKDPWALETQVQWMIKEMKDYGTYNRIKNVKDHKKAVEIFESEMERAGTPNYPARYAYASSAYGSFAGTKMQTGGAVFDPKKYQEGTQPSSRYIPVGTDNNAKSYSIKYAREGSSGTYIIKSISKLVKSAGVGKLIGQSDDLTSVKISSDEGKRVLNSANVHQYFRTVPGGGLSKNLKLELKPDPQSDMFWEYNQAYQTTKNAWMKNGQSKEQAESYAAQAAKVFAKTGKTSSLLPGASTELGNTSVSSSSDSSNSQEQTDAATIAEISKSLGNFYNAFNGVQKTNGSALDANSMNLVQNMKSKPFITDTYIVAPGNTYSINTNFISPIESIDYSVSSYSNLDSPSLLSKRKL